jgi:CheY-like chemotaxis protein
MGVDEKIILIIEDDEVFASYLYYLSHDNGYKVLIALNGEEGMLLIKQFKIQGIFLDIVLPDIEGWTILDFLKRTHDYQHIPVFIISVNNESQRSLRMGAKAHFNKPVDKEALVKAFDSLKSLNEHKKKKVLIVDNDDTSLKAIIDILEGSDIETRNIKIYPEALDILAKEDFDCMVLYLGNPDMFGINLLEQMHERCIDKIPVVVYIDREISKKEETHLKSLAKTMIIKNVQSPERLLDETSIFLHRLQDDIPEEKRKILTTLAPDPILKDKKVLIVDDDVRNIFAMISILERHQMQIFNAENGKDGIEQLQKLKDIDIILMDIMMPEMDGYEAMRQIRKIKRFSEIPIIAITAKAMKGDKEKCLMAGASDYVTKPIDINQLISTLRIWLNQ